MSSEADLIGHLLTRGLIFTDSLLFMPRSRIEKYFPEQDTAQ